MDAVRIKLNFQGMEMVFAELPPSEKEVMHGIVSGKAIPNMTKLTADLISIIAFLCKKLNLTEKAEEQIEINQVQQNTKDDPHEKRKATSIASSVDKDHEEPQEDDRNTSKTKDTESDGEDSERETFEGLLKIEQSMGAEDKCVGEPSENDNEMANEELESDKDCHEQQQEHGTNAEISHGNSIDEAKKAFYCTHCAQEFNTRRQLKKHENTHTAHKPFSCATCDKKFVSAAHLKRHDMTHSVKTEKMELDDTKAEIASTGQFNCAQCDKTFSRADHLKRHERTHSGDLYSSTYCNMK